MQVTLKYDNGDSNGTITVEVGESFVVEVDGSVLLEHGEKYETQAPEAPEASEQEVDNVSYEIAESSFIKGFEWNKEVYDMGDEVLEVELHNGKKYFYVDVPLYVAEDWKEECEAGESAGKYFNSNVKGIYTLVKELDKDGSEC